MSVSSAFCVLTAGTQLQTQTYGIYDRYIKNRIAEPFHQHRFKVQTPDNNFLLSQDAFKTTSLFHFDDLVRAKSVGYSNATELY